MHEGKLPLYGSWEARSEKEHSRLKKRRMNKEPKKYYKAYAVM